MKKNFYKSLLISLLFLATFSIIAFAGRKVATAIPGLTNVKDVVKKMRPLATKNKDKASTAITSIPADITINFNSSGFQEGVASGKTFTQGDFKFTYSGSSWYQDTDNGQSGTPGLFAADYSGTLETITIETTSSNEFDFVSFYVNLYGGGFSKIQGFKDGVSTGTQTVGTGFGETGGEFTATLNNTIFNDVDRVVITSNAFGFWDIFDTFVFERSKPAASNVQASNVTFTGVSTTSEKIDWTNGSGTSRMVLVSSTTTGTPNVVNGTSYTASSDYNSAGTVANSSSGTWRCVYNGTGSTVTVTNLVASAAYRVMVLEYSGAGASTVYNTSTAIDNPISFTTMASAPTSVQVSGTSSTSFSVAWTVRSGATSYEYDITTGLDNSFANPILTNVSVPTNSAVITGLTAGSTYRLRVRSVTNSGAGPSGSSVVVTTTTSNLIGAFYEFTAAVSGSSILTDPTPVPAPKPSDVTFGAFSYVGTGTSTVSTALFGVPGWPATDTQSSYYEVTLTPKTGVPLNLNQITYAINRNTGGPNKFYVRSSIDNYASNLPLTTIFTSPITATNNELSVGTTTGTFAGTTITLSSSFSNLLTPVTFRFYGYGASNTTTGQFNIDRVFFDGSTGSNNTAPTDMALSATSINENVAAASTVGTLSATDAEGGTMSYALVAGTGDTDNAAFTLTSAGSLSINASPNFETKSSYAIRVKVTDPGGLTFEKAFTITINDLNEAPTDIAISSSSINENVAANSTVGTLSSTDQDASNTFTYTLVSGTGDTNNSAFNISGSSLRITGVPDFENQNSYSIRVRTIDQSGLTFEKVINITISDLNEAPNDIFLSQTTLAENSVANLAIGTLSPGDPDMGGSHSYSLVAGTGDTDNGAFNISGNSLRFTGVANYEVKNNYSIRLRVTDQNNLTYEKAVAITITNTNDAPTLSGGPYVLTGITTSSTSTGVQVSTILGGVTAADEDNDPSPGIVVIGTSGTGTWQYSTDNLTWNNVGAVSTSTGLKLSSVTYIRYTANSSAETATLSFKVWDRTSSSSSSTNSARHLVALSSTGGTTAFSDGIASTTISVGLANTAPTDISLSATSINENVAANATLGTLSTTDADVSNTFTYSLVSGTGSTDNAAFAINGSNLNIVASPDFETKSSYSVRIRTTDQGGLTFEKVFSVTINNLNEAPTDIALSPTSLNENAIAGGPSGLLTATDPDAGNTFTYTLVSGAGSTDNAQFGILASSLRILSSPDFESKNSYSIRVRATDQGGLTFEKELTLTINNLNEAPVDLALSATAINENVAANSAVGTLSSFDPDAANTFTYTLVTGTGSTDNAAFNISGSSLRVTASPDFETKSSYSVRVRTTDQDGLTFEKAFIITINNVNEAPTNIALSASSISENVAANSTIGNLSSTDVDALNTFTYTLVSGTGDTNNAAFNISGNSLRISSSPDFENQNGYSIRLRATDQGGLTFDKVFNITISDVNEAPNDIFLSQASLAENSTANATVGTLSPGDPDMGGSHSYSLVSGTGDTDNSTFNISGNSLRFTGVANYEVKNSYSIRLRVTDQASLNYEKVFTINISNVNEAPSDIAISASTVNENVTANATVATLSSTDVDASNTFTYTLVSGIGSTDNAAFTISGGNLNIIASPDFETKNSYSVRVRTTDQGGLTFEKVFAITVVNLNEAPTNIALSASSINENVAANSTVGILSSADVDASNTFTYTLVSGTGDTDNTAFNISGSSLRLTASPDFEAKASYSIRIRTTDQDGLTFEKVFTISINNLNEAPTNIALSASSINENVVANSTVGTLSSTDVDASNTFTYTLVSGTGDTDNSSFNINGGSLRITASPDFETKNSYSVRVRTTDQDGLTFEKVFAITINNLNESPANIALSSSSINENVAANSTVGTLSSTDIDASNTFTYTLVTGTGDTDNAAFNINGGSLRISSSPDFETKNSYAVRVRTTDQDGLTFEKVFAISVNNLNEAPTNIALSSSSINENVAANSTVGTLSSTDVDASNTFTYTLVTGTGDTDNAAFNINGGSLRISSSPDFEIKNSYAVRIRTTDQDGLTFEKVFAISVNNLNEAPTDIALSTTSINENVTANSTVGTLSSTDIDAGNTFTYALVSGTGATDNAAFTISGNSLKITASPDYETKNSYSVRIGATDQGGLTFEKVFAVTINDVTELVFTTTSLVNAIVGTNYQQQINVTVGASPYTFAVTSGALPAGLTLSPGGMISGTPTAGGNFNLTITATDQNNVVGSYAYTLSVGAPTLALTANLPNAIVSSTYNETLGTTGGTAPYVYALDAGTLPPGLSLASTGTITGTPTTGGTYQFTVKATDASTGTGPYSSTEAYTFVVAPTSQTITFNANRTATYGDADFDPAATSTNPGIGITYSSGDNTVATIVNNKVHIVKAGTVTIYADQTGNASYTAATQKQQVLVISPKTLAVALTGIVSKTYDANSTATLTASNFALTGRVGADDVDINVPVNGVFASKNVGIGRLVTVSGLSLTGADRSNYQLATTSVNANIGLITAKPITLTLNAVPSITKVYNHNTLATLVPGNYALAGIETGDDVTVTGSASFDNARVGTAKVITGTAFVLSGADQSNYSLITTTATTTGAITAKPITLTLNAAPAITKVYDGNTTATLATGNYSLSGVETGDIVTVSSTAVYNDKTAAATKTISASAFVINGADKDNYSLLTTTATTTGSVTTKPITVALNATPAITKVYNADNTATLAAGNYILTGVVANDDVTVNGTGTYNTASVGTGKIVTANALILGGTDKNNYNLTTTVATTTGSVTAKPITVTLNATPTIAKVYDGNLSATLVAGNFNLLGVETGDVVTVSATSVYDNKTVGTGKAVVANAFVLGGANKDNYSLTTSSATTTGEVTAKPITVTVNALPTITKVYNGNNNATLAQGNYNLNGLVGGDVVTVTGTAVYNNATVGTGKTVTANAFVLGGADRNNYNLIITSANSTGAITPAALVVTADPKTRVQNTSDPVFTASYSGFVNGETVSVLSSLPTFSTTATLSSLPGQYQIIPGGAVATNYSITYVNGILTVTPGAPTSISLTQATLLENRPAGTLVGTLNSTSSDPNATFTYMLVSGAGDADNGLFAFTGQQLSTTASLNYEQKNTYSIRVRSTTQHGLTLDIPLSVVLTDVNEAPSFNAIANQVICAVGERRSIAITGISAGPETAQTTNLSLTNSNTTLFSELTVSNNGVLNYRTAAGRSGVANITVTIKDNGGTANGGVDTYIQNFTITVNPIPEAVITTDRGKVELSKGETLVLKASGGDIYNWLTAPGIVGARNGAELTIRPEATTTYTVEVTSAAGCTSTKSITITVEEDYVVVKGTNILTPNGDGKNDRFIIRNIDMYPKNTVKIYDRAGRLLFSQVNYTDQFDGTFQGSPLAEDTYYYIVDFGTDKPKLKGFITIVRD